MCTSVQSTGEELKYDDPVANTSKLIHLSRLKIIIETGPHHCRRSPLVQESPSESSGEEPRPKHGPRIAHEAKEGTNLSWYWKQGTGVEG